VPKFCTKKHVHKNFDEIDPKQRTSGKMTIFKYFIIFGSFLIFGSVLKTYFFPFFYAVRKIFLESGVNFINILLVNFSPIFWRRQKNYKAKHY